jgi:hypothetical protein
MVLKKGRNPGERETSPFFPYLTQNYWLSILCECSGRLTPESYMTYVFQDEAKARRLYEKIATGAQTTYNAKEHIPLLLDIFSQGRDIAAFCVAAEMSRVTFHQWIKKYKDFAAAYETAKEMACDYFERLGEERIGDPGFNLGLWSLMMRNRFGYTNERKVKLAKMRAAKSAMDQLNVIKDEISEGNLTASEVTHMGNFVLTGVKVDENTVMKNDVEQMKEIVMKGKIQ